MTVTGGCTGLTGDRMPPLRSAVWTAATDRPSSAGRASHGPTDSPSVRTGCHDT